MPVNKTIKISDTRFLAVWHIEESFEQLLNVLQPNSEDHKLLGTFRNKNKQLEWLAGRLTLKYLAEQLGVDYQGVTKDADGKPSLRNCDYEISLTHAFPYVAAIIDKTISVGIDLEQPRDKIVRLAPKFLSEEEIEFCENDITALNIMWCVKETLYKVHGKKGISFKEHLSIDPFDLSALKPITGNIIANGTVESHKLEYIINRNYMLTYNI